MTVPSGFTAPDRNLLEEDSIRLVSVGVDIGSSTSHLVFSRITLERRDNRYEVVKREILRESAITFTPYTGGTTIDAAALHTFIEGEYREAGITRSDVDTGALILTGVALERDNARAIAEMFAAETGKFVSVSAGDNLEATLAAYGSGAVARSAELAGVVLNVDIGGGTTKLALCDRGRVRDVAALDIGARLVTVDDAGAVSRLEEAGAYAGTANGMALTLGGAMPPDGRERLAAWMARQLGGFIANTSDWDRKLLRTAPLEYPALNGIVFSGGVSEFIYENESRDFGDLGLLLGRELRGWGGQFGVPIYPSAGRIRATVVGASQFTVQVSGSTIFLSSTDVVPLRNVPVIAPHLDLAPDPLDEAVISSAVATALRRTDLHEGNGAVAVKISWAGSATFQRLQTLCGGLQSGLASVLGNGHPVVLVCDGDVGGLLGLHLKEEMHLANPVVSVDGIELSELDYVDIGAMIPTSGAVPVVIKSLVFPAQGA